MSSLPVYSKPNLDVTDKLVISLPQGKITYLNSLGPNYNLYWIKYQLLHTGPEYLGIYCYSQGIVLAYGLVAKHTSLTLIKLLVHTARLKTTSSSNKEKKIR